MAQSKSEMLKEYRIKVVTEINEATENIEKLKKSLHGTDLGSFGQDLQKQIDGIEASLAELSKKTDREFNSVKRTMKQNITADVASQFKTLADTVTENVESIVKETNALNAALEFKSNSNNGLEKFVDSLVKPLGELKTSIDEATVQLKQLGKIRIEAPKTDNYKKSAEDIIEITKDVEKVIKQTLKQSFKGDFSVDISKKNIVELQQYKSEIEAFVSTLDELKNKYGNSAKFDQILSKNFGTSTRQIEALNRQLSAAINEKIKKVNPKDLGDVSVKATIDLGNKTDIAKLHDEIQDVVDKASKNVKIDVPITPITTGVIGKIKESVADINDEIRRDPKLGIEVGIKGKPNRESIEDAIYDSKHKPIEVSGAFKGGSIEISTDSDLSKEVSNIAEILSSWDKSGIPGTTKGKDGYSAATRKVDDLRTSAISGFIGLKTKNKVISDQIKGEQETVDLLKTMINRDEALKSVIKTAQKHSKTFDDFQKQSLYTSYVVDKETGSKYSKYAGSVTGHEMLLEEWQNFLKLMFDKQILGLSKDNFQDAVDVYSAQIKNTIIATMSEGKEVSDEIKKEFDYLKSAFSFATTLSTLDKRINGHVNDLTLNGVTSKKDGRSNKWTFGGKYQLSGSGSISEQLQNTADLYKQDLEYEYKAKKEEYSTLLEIQNLSRDIVEMSKNEANLKKEELAIYEQKKERLGSLTRRFAGDTIEEQEQNQKKYERLASRRNNLIAMSRNNGSLVQEDYNELMSIPAKMEKLFINVDDVISIALENLKMGADGLSDIDRQIALNKGEQRKLKANINEVLSDYVLSQYKVNPETLEPLNREKALQYVDSKSQYYKDKKVVEDLKKRLVLIDNLTAQNISGLYGASSKGMPSEFANTLSLSKRNNVQTSEKLYGTTSDVLKYRNTIEREIKVRQANINLYESINEDLAKEESSLEQYTFKQLDKYGSAADVYNQYFGRVETVEKLKSTGNYNRVKLGDNWTYMPEQTVVKEQELKHIVSDEDISSLFYNLNKAEQDKVVEGLNSLTEKIKAERLNKNKDDVIHDMFLDIRNEYTAFIKDLIAEETEAIKGYKTSHAQHEGERKIQGYNDILEYWQSPSSFIEKHKDSNKKLEEANKALDSFYERNAKSNDSAIKLASLYRTKIESFADVFNSLNSIFKENNKDLASFVGRGDPLNNLAGMLNQYKNSISNNDTLFSYLNNNNIALNKNFGKNFAKAINEELWGKSGIGTISENFLGEYSVYTNGFSSELVENLMNRYITTKDNSNILFDIYTEVFDSMNKYKDAIEYAKERMVRIGESEDANLSTLSDFNRNSIRDILTNGYNGLYSNKISAIKENILMQNETAKRALSQGKTVDKNGYTYSGILHNNELISNALNPIIEFQSDFIKTFDPSNVVTIKDASDNLKTFFKVFREKIVNDFGAKGTEFLSLIDNIESAKNERRVDSGLVRTQTINKIVSKSVAEYLEEFKNDYIGDTDRLKNFRDAISFIEKRDLSSKESINDLALENTNNKYKNNALYSEHKQRLGELKAGLIEDANQFLLALESQLQLVKDEGGDTSQLESQISRLKGFKNSNNFRAGQLIKFMESNGGKDFLQDSSIDKIKVEDKLIEKYEKENDILVARGAIIERLQNKLGNAQYEQVEIPYLEYVFNKMAEQKYAGVKSAEDTVLNTNAVIQREIENQKNYTFKSNFEKSQVETLKEKLALQNQEIENQKIIIANDEKELNSWKRNNKITEIRQQNNDLVGGKSKEDNLKKELELISKIDTIQTKMANSKNTASSSDANKAELELIKSYSELDSLIEQKKASFELYNFDTVKLMSRLNINKNKLISLIEQIQETESKISKETSIIEKSESEIEHANKMFESGKSLSTNIKKISENRNMIYKSSSTTTEENGKIKSYSTKENATATLVAEYEKSLYDFIFENKESFIGNFKNFLTGDDKTRFSEIMESANRELIAAGNKLVSDLKGKLSKASSDKEKDEIKAELDKLRDILNGNILDNVDKLSDYIRLNSDDLNITNSIDKIKNDLTGRTKESLLDFVFQHATAAKNAIEKITKTYSVDNYDKLIADKNWRVKNVEKEKEHLSQLVNAKSSLYSNKIGVSDIYELIGKTDNKSYKDKVLDLREKLSEYDNQTSNLSKDKNRLSILESESEEIRKQIELLESRDNEQQQFQKGMTTKTQRTLSSQIDEVLVEIDRLQTESVEGSKEKIIELTRYLKTLQNEAQAIGLSVSEVTGRAFGGGNADIKSKMQIPGFGYITQASVDQYSQGNSESKKDYRNRLYYNYSELNKKLESVKFDDKKSEIKRELERLKTFIDASGFDIVETIEELESLYTELNELDANLEGVSERTITRRNNRKSAITDRLRFLQSRLTPEYTAALHGTKLVPDTNASQEDESKRQELVLDILKKKNAETELYLKMQKESSDRLEAQLALDKKVSELINKQYQDTVKIQKIYPKYSNDVKTLLEGRYYAGMTEDQAEVTYQLKKILASTNNGKKANEYQQNEIARLQGIAKETGLKLNKKGYAYLDGMTKDKWLANPFGLNTNKYTDSALFTNGNINGIPAQESTLQKILGVISKGNFGSNSGNKKNYSSTSNKLSKWDKINLNSKDEDRQKEAFINNIKAGYNIFKRDDSGKYFRSKQDSFDGTTNVTKELIKSLDINTEEIKVSNKKKDSENTPKSDLIRANKNQIKSWNKQLSADGGIEDKDLIKQILQNNARIYKNEETNTYFSARKGGKYKNSVDVTAEFAKNVGIASNELGKFKRQVADATTKQEKGLAYSIKSDRQEWASSINEKYRKELESGKYSKELSALLQNAFEHNNRLFKNEKTGDYYFTNYNSKSKGEELSSSVMKNLGMDFSALGKYKSEAVNASKEVVSAEKEIIETEKIESDFIEKSIEKYKELYTIRKKLEENGKDYSKASQDVLDFAKKQTYTLKNTGNDEDAYDLVNQFANAKLDLDKKFDVDFIAKRISELKAEGSKESINLVKSAFSEMEEAGSELGVKFAKGIESSSRSVKVQAMKLPQEVIDTIKEKLAIHSPSRVAEALGFYTGEGFNNGLEKSREELIATASKLTDDVLTKLYELQKRSAHASKLEFSKQETRHVLEAMQEELQNRGYGIGKNDALISPKSKRGNGKNAGDQKISKDVIALERARLDYYKSQNVDKISEEFEERINALWNELSEMTQNGFKNWKAKVDKLKIDVKQADPMVNLSPEEEAEVEAKNVISSLQKLIKATKDEKRLDVKTSQNSDYSAAWSDSKNVLDEVRKDFEGILDYAERIKKTSLVSNETIAVIDELLADYGNISNMYIPIGEGTAADYVGRYKYLNASYEKAKENQFTGKASEEDLQLISIYSEAEKELRKYIEALTDEEKETYSVADAIKQQAEMMDRLDTKASKEATVDNQVQTKELISAMKEVDKLNGLKDNIEYRRENGGFTEEEIKALQDEADLLEIRLLPLLSKARDIYENGFTGDNLGSSESMTKLLSTATEFLNRYNSVGIQNEKKVVDVDSFNIKRDKFSSVQNQYSNDFKNEVEQLDELIKTYKNMDLSVEDNLENAKNIRQQIVELISTLDSKIKDSNERVVSEARVNKSFNSFKDYANRNTKASKGQFKQEFEDIEKMYNALNKLNTTRGQIEGIEARVEALKSKVVEAGATGGRVLDTIKNRLQDMNAKYLARFFSLYDWIRYIRTAVNTVTELDTALTELRKVSDATNQRLQQSFEKSAETAKKLGATITDTISATSDWARLGYSVDDAEKLAEISVLYKNVGDNIDINSASSYLISALQGYELEADQALSIVDKYNEVGNNFAINTAEIGEALKRSAASFQAAHTDINKSIALVTAANTVVQNPETVGTAFKTLSARLRGAKTELEELGEEQDTYTKSTSKLREQIKAMTGFDILEDDEETFKDIYDIILGISEAWKDLSDVDRASLGEALAGKRNANVLYAILNGDKGVETLKKAYKTAEESAGSAMKEQANYEQSIQYSLDKMKASLQELAHDFVDSGLVKDVVDFGDKVINIIDTIIEKIGLLGTISIGGGAFLGVKKLGKRKCTVSYNMPRLINVP